MLPTEHKTTWRVAYLGCRVAGMLCEKGGHHGDYLEWRGGIELKCVDMVGILILGFWSCGIIVGGVDLGSWDDLVYANHIDVNQ